MLGLLPRIDGVLTGAKLVVIWALVLFASAAASQLIARAARRDQADAERAPGSRQACSTSDWRHSS
ncbi:MAG: hypothetical protein OSW71_11755 [Proteobacteria bacterium]|nr:hypothetical protein [Pseudomonadota bacterium]